MAHKEKLLIIDAHALIHRAFHALPPLTTKDKQQINAVYGFLLILLRALKDIKPEYIAVTFDSKGKTFRHEKYKEYKANRPPAPDELKSQFPIVQEVVKTFGFPVYAVKGYEADDLIGTICKQLDSKKDVETIIVTGDLDMLQLVDKNTKVLKLQQGVKQTLLYDEKTVKEKHGLEPKQIIEYKGLRGDSSDNIPGVKGVGEKGATTLLQEYKSIAEIYKHLDDIEGRAKKALDGQKKEAELSRDLAVIAEDAPIEFTLSDAAIKPYDQKAITKAFQKYEFKSLLTQLHTLPGFEIKEGLFAPKGDTEEPEQRVRDPKFKYHLVQSDKEIEALANKLSQQKIFAFDTETSELDVMRARLVGVSFSWNAQEGYYIPCGNKVPSAIKKILEDASIQKTGHHIKYDIEALLRADVEMKGVAFDSMLASYLLNSGSRGHGLDNLAFVEFGHQMQPIEELIGKGKKQISMADVPVEDVSWYACEDADFTWRLYKKYQPLLEKEGLKDIMNDIELPIIHTLVAMEEAGVKIDVEFLNQMSKKLHRRISTLEKNIQKHAGQEFNVASNVQLKEILFEKLQLPTDKIKKTKTGFSTAASELEKLRGSHPIIEMIEEFRELSKLTSTYIDTLPELINPRTGRIHSSFNQTITATGRLSSLDPNLQNIPIRTELGREIRKAFVPERGHRLLSCDYSQIELRVVAHLAKDRVMMEAFKNGEDIHVRTAAELNEVALDTVSKDMRRQSKAINFGILYGMGVQGIMRDSGISRNEAQEFLDKYFTIHDGIRKYLDSVKDFARSHGYAETLLGRRRPLPEINSSNRMIAAGAERAAVNMPVQGFASDLMKIAMIQVQEAIDQGKIDARMILQVHDELVFEIKSSKVKAEAKKIKKIMEEVYKLNVPLVVDAEAGTNWGELQEV